MENVLLLSVYKRTKCKPQELNDQNLKRHSLL
jgi:hypothetical protein